MSQSIKYMSIALQTIRVYQNQLIKQLNITKNQSSAFILDFKKFFDHHLNKIKNIQMQKFINQDKISDCLEDMKQFLQKSIRIKKTSQSERYNYRANLGTRQTQRMRLTGFQFAKQKKDYPLGNNLNQISQIVQSYKIIQSSAPHTKMKWRMSVDQDNNKPYHSKQLQKNDFYVKQNNIQLLNVTIPEIQNRIKLLSVSRNRSPKRNSSIDQTKQIYRTLQTRGHTFRRQIPRLF